MRRRFTPDQSTLASFGVLVLALVCAWRWWIAPSLAAAREAATPELAAAREAAANTLDAAFDQHSAELRWRPPGACVEVYRVHVDEQFRDASVARFVGREEEHSRWLLALGRRGDTVVSVLMPADAGEDGESVRERELTFAAAAGEVGPAAPDFACRRRSWDPLEDALALGWPRLPDRRVRVGEAWIGATVGGRCHETVCANEQGKFEHDRRCQARPWHERLAGAGRGLALIVGDWDDGHELGQIGVLTSRTSVLDEGRPLHVRASVDHRWSGVHRELELTRVDDCDGTSLATAEDEAAVAHVRARFESR